MISTLIRSWIAMAALVITPIANAQSTIELRSTARVGTGSAVTLSQIATLTGADAAALAEVAVVPAGASRGSKINIQEVRRAIESHGAVNWGRVTLRGSVCTLMAAQVEAKPVQKAPMTTTPLSDDPDSVRRAVADRISLLVQTQPADLRLSFDAGDAEILNLSMTGRTLEVKPTAASDKLPLALTLYEGDRILATKSIRVGVLVRRKVVIAAAAKSRGETIAEGDVTIDVQWVGPNLKTASAETVVGAAAQGRIATGQIIGVGDVAAANIVSKGDQVTVSCVSGSVVLTTKARAMSAGRVGDVIQFQGLEDKRVFSARMSGRGRAVVTATPAMGATTETLP